MEGTLSSWKALGWAKEQRAGSPLNKLVLLLIAERADERFSCYPSVRLLAEEAEATPRGVRLALRHLESAGLITTVAQTRASGARTSSRYYVNHPDAAHRKAPEVSSPPPGNSVPGDPEVGSPPPGTEFPVRGGTDFRAKKYPGEGRDDEEDAPSRDHESSPSCGDPLTGRPALRGLAAALRDAGIRASWPTDPARLAEITALVGRHELDELVAAAVQQDTNAARTPGRTPAEYVTAYVRRWRSMPPSPTPRPGQAVSDFARPPAQASRAEAAAALARAADVRASAVQTIAAARARAS